MGSRGGVVLLLFVSLVVAGCQSTQPATSTPQVSAAPAAASASPSAVAAVSLSASYSETIASNLPEWFAADEGIFQAHGLNVQLNNIASSTGVPALLSNQVQIAQLGGSEVLSAMAGGAQLEIIGVLGDVYPFVFMAPASITTTDQLKGKKIGVSNVGSTSDIATRVMLQRIGLSPDTDVTIVPVGSLQNRTAALLNGAIDGGLAQPPEQLGLEDQGFHVLYDLAAQKLPAAGDAIVVQRSWLKDNHDVAQRYIDAMVEAAARSHADRADALNVLSKYLSNTDQRALNATYDFFVGSVLTVYPNATPDLLTDSVNQLALTNPNVKNVDLSTVIDNSLVQNAMDRHVGG